jgi:hypothetical protein
VRQVHEAGELVAQVGGIPLFSTRSCENLTHSRLDYLQRSCTKPHRLCQLTQSELPSLLVRRQRSEWLKPLRLLRNIEGVAYVNQW